MLCQLYHNKKYNSHRHSNPCVTLLCKSTCILNIMHIFLYFLSFRKFQNGYLHFTWRLRRQEIYQSFLSGSLPYSPQRLARTPNTQDETSSSGRPGPVVIIQLITSCYIMKVPVSYSIRSKATCHPSVSLPIFF